MRLPTGIIDMFTGGAHVKTTTRGRLRYRGPETGKWRVCGAFKIEENEATHPHYEDFLRKLGCLAASAAIHNT
jgi:hypothetical protein